MSAELSSFDGLNIDVGIVDGELVDVEEGEEVGFGFVEGRGVGGGGGIGVGEVVGREEGDVGFGFAEG